VQSSPQRLDTLAAICGEENMEKLEPSSDVVTRWNSVYKMICRVKELENELCKFFPAPSQQQISCLLLSQSEFQILEQLCQLLELVYEMSTTMCGSTYATAAKIIPAFNKLVDIMNDIATSDSEKPFIKATAKRIADTLIRYYSKTTISTMIPIALHPGYRREYFEALFSDDIDEPASDIMESENQLLVDLNKSLYTESTISYRRFTCQTQKRQWNNQNKKRLPCRPAHKMSRGPFGRDQQ